MMFKLLSILFIVFGSVLILIAQPATPGLVRVVITNEKPSLVKASLYVSMGGAEVNTTSGSLPYIVRVPSTQSEFP